jgi:hypothetical protein
VQPLHGCSAPQRRIACADDEAGLNLDRGGVVWVEGSVKHRGRERETQRSEHHSRKHVNAKADVKIQRIGADRMLTDEMISSRNASRIASIASGSDVGYGRRKCKVTKVVRAPTQLVLCWQRCSCGEQPIIHTCQRVRLGIQDHASLHHNAVCAGD